MAPTRRWSKTTQVIPAPRRPSDAKTGTDLVMANVLAPFGFAQVGVASGKPNFARAGSGNPYRIKASFTTPIYYGDAVRMWITGDSVTGAAGYITPWVAADGVGDPTKILVGIFLGCDYYSSSQRQNTKSNFWPGGDAAADGAAYVCDDPSSQWMVQAGTAATPITQAYIGMSADIKATPVGSTITGISGMVLDTPTITSSNTLPFKVVNIVNTPPTANGRDVATAYNYVNVAFNNQQYKALLGV